MEITEQEQVKLIMSSTRENVVCFSFGPNIVRLRVIPENEWAINLVIKWREENKN